MHYWFVSSVNIPIAPPVKMSFRQVVVAVGGRMRDVRCGIKPLMVYQWMQCYY
jgi:hypothetical protein